MAAHEPQHIQLSLELLQLLYWIAEHEQNTLKQIMTRAARAPELSSMAELTSPSAAATEEHIRDHVIHFFNTLETLLQETREETQATEQLRSFLVPSVNRIDSSQCDIETITRSAERAKRAMEEGTAQNSKEALCRALMKQWHPQLSKQDRH